MTEYRMFRARRGDRCAICGGDDCVLIWRVFSDYLCIRCLNWWRNGGSFWSKAA